MEVIGHRELTPEEIEITKRMNADAEKASKEAAEKWAKMTDGQRKQWMKDRRHIWKRWQSETGY